MKPPSLAPVYATLYPGLCDIARSNGYALAIHGSLTADLDVIAVPWVDDAAPAETLIAALRTHLGAFDLLGLTQCNLGRELTAEEIAEIGLTEREPTLKPHGRRSWNAYLPNGAKIDISVTPRVPPPFPSASSL